MIRRPSSRWTARRGRVAALAAGVALASAKATAASTAPLTADDASERARVLIVAATDSALTERLEAELRYARMIPQLVRPTRAMHDPSTWMRRTGAAAMIRVDEVLGRIELYVADPATDTLVEELSLGAPTESPRDLAIDAVERLRSALRQRRGETPGPSTDPRSPPPTMLDPPPPPPPPPPRFGVTAAIAVGDAPGLLPVATHGRIQLRSMPSAHVGVVFVATAMLHRAPDATTEVTTAGISAGPRFSLRAPDSVIVPDLSTTIGAIVVDRRSAAPGAAVYPLVVDARVEAAAGLELRLSSRLRLRTEAAAAVCTRTLRVRTSGRRVSGWCSPHVLGALGLAVVFG